ncbi:MAG: helix-turn-helix transcriptional regulator [Bacilli bacterium]|nr:helix-turn-helix transcriptional regulator [Bacilli bacterium]
MKLFDKIRILRKARGLSQEQLGYSLSRVNKDGISRQTVSDWENGKFEPKLENIRDLAEVFNVSFDALLDESVDLENEKVLEAVLNKKPYEKEKEYENEEQIVAPKIERKRITFKELAVLLISGFFTFQGVSNMIAYILSLIEISSFEYATGLLIDIAIQLVLLGIFGVAFAFTINAIFRNKSLKAPLILLIIGTGLNFALTTYVGIFSLIAHLDGHMKGASSYTVNGYPSTYEKMVAGAIVRVVYSELVNTAFLVASILLFIFNRKQQKIETVKTTAAEVY